jgi:hypothetical protein
MFPSVADLINPALPPEPALEALRRLSVRDYFFATTMVLIVANTLSTTSTTTM